MSSPDPTPVIDPARITAYHAHVYYDPLTTRDRAARLRQRVGERFPQARIGRWHDELVGPHTRSMYQIAFPADLIAALLPFLMLNRDGMTVLLHPETGNDYRDHSVHAVWFGAVLPLRLDGLKGAPAAGGLSDGT
jgi:DOPA 4,5-dioxygenase